MRHLFPQISLLSCMLLFFIFPFAHGQELTEAERKERCEVNNKSLLEYDQKLADLKRIRSNIEKYSILHNDYTELHYAINHRKLLERYNTMKRRHDAVSEYDMKWNSLWDKNIDAFQKALRNKIGADLMETSKYTLEAIQEDIQIINGQIEVHEKRIADLHCADFQKEMASKNKNTPENEVQQQGEESIVKLKPAEEKITDNKQSPKNQEAEQGSNQLKPDKEAMGWTGTWDGANTTIIITGGNKSISATFTYEVGDSKGTNGTWSSCKLNSGWLGGKYAECRWTIHHEDKTKHGDRKGKLEVELKGDVISGTYFEEEPDFTYNEGYTKENVNSSMKNKATWVIQLKRNVEK